MEFESVSGLTAFIHVYDESLQSLESFEIEDLSSFILFVMDSENLPRCIQKLFEKQMDLIFPTMNSLVAFNQDRIKVLENIGLSVNKGMSKDKALGKFGMKSSNKMVMIATQDDSKGKCPLYKSNHDIKVFKITTSKAVDIGFKLS